MGLTPGRALPRLFFLTGNFALLTLLLTAGCARITPLPETAPIKTFSPGMLFLADHRQISLAELARMAQQADYILIGESHANPCDHQFQKDALAALVQAGLAPGLGLEMVTWDRQNVLDAFHQGEIPLDLLEERLDWPSSWGYPFSLYRPILEQAWTLGIPLVALNTPKELVGRIRDKGLEGVPEDERGRLPRAIILPVLEQKKQLEEEYLQHTKMMRGHAQAEDFTLQRFLLIQSLWDTQMAHLAAAWHKATGRPMVILTGSGHVNFGHGIAHRLAVLEDAPRILTLTPWRGEPLDPALADVFFFCPEEPARQRLGVKITWQDGQAVIMDVLPGSRAEKADLRAGDIILVAGGQPVDALDVLHQEGMSAVTHNQPLSLKILRGGAPITLDVIF